MPKPAILVAYYSRTGSNRKVAQALAKGLGADLEEIREDRSRSGVLGFLASGFAGFMKRGAKILPPSKEPSKYGLVIVGTPVWAGSVSSPMRQYLLENKEKLKSIAAFCACGDPGNAGKVFADIEKITGLKPVATMAIKGISPGQNASSYSDSNFKAELAGFIARLR